MSFRGSEATEKSQIPLLHYIPVRNDIILHAKVYSRAPKVTYPCQLIGRGEALVKIRQAIFVSKQKPQWELHIVSIPKGASYRLGVAGSDPYRKESLVSSTMRGTGGKSGMKTMRQASSPV